MYPFGFDLIVVLVVLMVPRAIGVLVVPTVSSVIVVLAVPIPLIVRVGTVVLVVPTLHSMCVCVAIDVFEVQSVVILIFLLVLFSVTVRCREYGLSRWSANRKNTMW